MEDAKAAAGEHCKVVAVTVLTSLDDDDLASVGVPGGAHDQALRLADLAQEAGLDGIVCSGHEVGAIHKRWKHGFFVVPGLRPDTGSSADQKRIVTPASRAGRWGERACHWPPDQPRGRPGRCRARHRSHALNAPRAMTTYRLAEPVDVPAIRALIERGYRGDSARRGWTHEADLLEGDRTSEAEIAAIVTRTGPAHAAGRARRTRSSAPWTATDLGRETAYMGMLCVDPALQAGGLGRELIARIEGAGRAGFRRAHDGAHRGGSPRRAHRLLRTARLCANWRTASVPAAAGRAVPDGRAGTATSGLITGLATYPS